MKVNEIFKSINGEVCHFGQGSIATFVRLAGCNLTCNYCDTEYANIPNAKVTEMSVEEVLDDINYHDTDIVTITGGEPLLQIDEVIELCERLSSEDVGVSIETNGTIDFSRITYPEAGQDLSNVYLVADFKTPSTGIPTMLMTKTMENMRYLTTGDIVKFVVSTKKDLDFAFEMIKELEDLDEYVVFAISPCLSENFGSLKVKEVYRKMMSQNGLNAILNVQLHKLLDVK